MELPHKQIHPNRLKIQDDKYAKKTDWDEQPRFRRYVEKHRSQHSCVVSIISIAVKTAYQTDQSGRQAKLFLQVTAPRRKDGLRR